MMLTQKIRQWLIKKIAGKTAVVMNCHIKDQEIIIYNGKGAIIDGCTISTQGTAIMFDDVGEPINAVLPFPDSLSGF